MSTDDFAAGCMARLVDRIAAATLLEERHGEGGGPLLALSNVSDGGPAGALRLWAISGPSRLDRLVHFRLHSPPVDTHLLFLFGRADTAVPHFHAQVVQFGPDACVYNADIIPRLDAVEHPGWFREVYGPVTKAYWRVVFDAKNVAAMAPANPAIATYLSCWGIAAGRPTNRAEVERAWPSIEAYLDRCLALARDLDYAGPSPAALRERDRRHMEIFHGDDLDPRAWKGVYQVIGAATGRRVKEIFATPLH
jgi:hypothetical protein